MQKPHGKKSDKKRKAPGAGKSPASFPAQKAKPKSSAKPKPAEPRKQVVPEAASASVEHGAQISRRAADRLRAGHLWVYASDVEAVAANEGNPPVLLPVADNRGLLLGTALYSPTSQIALRMVSRTAIDEAEWLVLLEDRLRTAVRKRLPILDAENNACRLVFSEADEIPGLVADKYGKLIILQLLARGLDSAEVRKACVRVLREELQPASILERPDPRIRELEGISAPSLAPLWAANPEAPTTHAIFHLNGLQFHFDANAGQKTGAFLDQRKNYAAAAEWAHRLGTTGRVLDVCTYQGGFALHLARVAQRVTGVDVSHASLEVAERNLESNRGRNQIKMSAEVDWVEADAFELLRDWSDARESFDTIVVDPPAFAKSRRAVEGALRGYKELNLRALKMVRPGGLLVTCSCSHHVDWVALEGAVSAAAADAHRRVRVVERRMAAPDHPVVLNLPETEYLKCLVLQVE